MAVPRSRSEFKEFCLRRLGKGATKVNLTESQAEDAIDVALKRFSDYHFDGSERIFYKYVVEAGNRPDAVYRVRVVDGGSGYSEGEALVFQSVDGKGEGAAGTVSVDSLGSITSVVIGDHGDRYAGAPSVTVDTVGGAGAVLEAELGGWFQMPENVVGAVEIFPLGVEVGVNNIFNIRYQIAINDLYTLTSVSMVPYVMAMTHVQFLEEVLAGRKPIRYNRYKGRLYVDMDWRSVEPGTVIVAVAYEVVDPEEFPKIWSDRWLQEYATQQMKLTYATVLTKYGGMPGPGGVTFNWQKMYDDAQDRIDKLDAELLNSYSLPAMDFLG